MSASPSTTAEAAAAIRRRIIDELELRFYYAGNVGETREQRLASSSYTADLLTRPNSLARRMLQNIEYVNGPPTLTEITGTLATAPKAGVEQHADGSLTVTCEHWAPSLEFGFSEYASLDATLANTDKDVVRIEFDEPVSARLGLRLDDKIDMRLRYDPAQPAPVNIDGKPLLREPTSVDIRVNSHLVETANLPALTARWSRARRIRLAATMAIRLLCFVTKLRIVHAAWLSARAHLLPLTDPSANNNDVNGVETKFNDFLTAKFPSTGLKTTKLSGPVTLNDEALLSPQTVAEIVADAAVRSDAGNTVLRITSGGATPDLGSERDQRRARAAWLKTMRGLNNTTKSEIKKASRSKTLVVKVNVLNTAKNSVAWIQTFKFGTMTSDEQELVDDAYKQFENAFDLYAHAQFESQTNVLKKCKKVARVAALLDILEALPGTADKLAALYALAVADSAVDQIVGSTVSSAEIARLRFTSAEVVSCLRATSSSIQSVFAWSHASSRLLELFADNTLWSPSSTYRSDVYAQLDELIPRINADLQYRSGISIELSADVHRLLKNSKRAWELRIQSLATTATRMGVDTRDDVSEEGNDNDASARTDSAQTVDALKARAASAVKSLDAIINVSQAAHTSTSGYSQVSAITVQTDVRRLLTGLTLPETADDAFDFSGVDLTAIFSAAVVPLEEVLVKLDAMQRIFSGDDEDKVRKSLAGLQASQREKVQEDDARAEIELIMAGQARTIIERALAKAAESSAKFLGETSPDDAADIGTARALAVAKNLLRLFGIVSVSSTTVQLLYSVIDRQMSALVTSGGAQSVRTTDFERPLASLRHLTTLAHLDTARVAASNLQLSLGDIERAEFEQRKAIGDAEIMATQRAVGRDAHRALIAALERIVDRTKDDDGSIAQYVSFINALVASEDFVGFVPMPAPDLRRDRRAEVQENLSANIIAFDAEQDEYYDVIRPQLRGFDPTDAGGLVDEVVLREGWQEALRDVISSHQVEFSGYQVDLPEDADVALQTIDTAQQTVATELETIVGTLDAAAQTQSPAREIVAEVARLAETLSTYFERTVKLVPRIDSAGGQGPQVDKRHRLIVTLETAIYQWRTRYVPRDRNLAPPPSRAGVSTQEEIDRQLDQLGVFGDMLPVGALDDDTSDDDDSRTEEDNDIVDRANAAYDAAASVTLSGLGSLNAEIEAILVDARDTADLDSDTLQTFDGIADLVRIRAELHKARAFARELAASAKRKSVAEDSLLPTQLGRARFLGTDLGATVAHLQTSPIFAEISAAREEAVQFGTTLLDVLGKLQNSVGITAAQNGTAADIYTKMRADALDAAARASKRADADVNSALASVSKQLASAQKLERSTTTSLAQINQLRDSGLEAFLGGDSRAREDSLEGIAEKLQQAEVDTRTLSKLAARASRAVTARATVDVEYGSATSALERLTTPDAQNEVSARIAAMQQVLANQNAFLAKTNAVITAVAQSSKKVNATAVAFDQAQASFAAIQDTELFKQLSGKGSIVDGESIVEQSREMEKTATAIARESKRVISTTNKAEAALAAYSNAKEALARANTTLTDLSDESAQSRLAELEAARATIGTLDAASRRITTSVKTAEKSLAAFEAARAQLELVVPSVVAAQNDAAQQVQTVQNSAAAALAALQKSKTDMDAAAAPVFAAKKVLDGVVDTVNILIGAKPNTASVVSVAREISLLSTGIALLLTSNNIEPLNLNEEMIEAINEAKAGGQSPFSEVDIFNTEILKLQRENDRLKRINKLITANRGPLNPRRPPTQDGQPKKPKVEDEDDDEDFGESDFSEGDDRDDIVSDEDEAGESGGFTVPPGLFEA